MSRLGLHVSITVHRPSEAAMLRRGVVLAAWIGALALLCVNGQENETCTTESCGVESW